MSNSSEERYKYPSNFQKHVGFEVVRNDSGIWIARLDVVTQHLNRSSSAHGGVILTLLDVAGAAAVTDSVENLNRMSTISLTANFLSPARPGIVTAVANVERAGKVTASTSIKLYQGDETGDLVATGIATYRLFCD
ncbi:MAG: PaaI family thioesterase [Rhodospirillales bacterium]|nr:PaaI family thioesterase [Rhodospirillales bacterium]